MENPVITLLKHHVDTNGGRPAIFYRDEVITYNELFKNIKAYASLLRKSGLKDGDRFLISLPDCPQFAYAFLGGIYGGCIGVPVNNTLDRELTEYILNDSEAKAMFIAPDALSAESKSPLLQHTFFTDDSGNSYKLDDTDDMPPAAYTPDKLGYMVYTSGSTGFPKGVPHYGKSMLQSEYPYAKDVLKVTKEDVILTAAKMFFVYGLIGNTTFALSNGASFVLMPEKLSFSPIEKNIKQHKPTIFMSVPSLLNMMIKESPELFKNSRIRLAVSAGENLPPSLAEEFMREAGITVLDGYGCSETTCIVIGNYPNDIHLGKTGVPMGNWQCRLTDAQENNVRDGEPGILWVKGATLMPYYWRDREKAEKPIEWFCTHDIFIRENGVYNYVGRNNDMFKCEGNWVSPVQVEKILMMHPAVMECGVTGKHLLDTLRPFAYVVTNVGYEPSLKLETELVKFCRKYMAAAMCPVSFTFCTELPKTATGKIQRFRLCEIDKEVQQ